jgi:outer membrane protein OmpA-like peptidoglycan-associated protein
LVRAVHVIYEQNRRAEKWKMVVRRMLFESVPRRALVVGMVCLLGGCSSVPDAVNPIAWYRDLSGASKDDKLDKNQPNQANLDAGGKQPYPNLADVPNPPDTATSAIDRDALQKNLIADRQNATYSDEQLRATMPTPGLVSPPPPQSRAPASAPAAGSQAAAGEGTQDTAAAQESSLRSPTIPSVPTGEPPQPAPPPPNITPAPKVASTEPAATPPPAAGERRATPGSSAPAATIVFAVGSADLADSERDRLSQLAAMQHASGNAIRIIGHAESVTGTVGSQQKLAQFKLALARAQSVGLALKSDGVPEPLIEVEAAPGRAGDADASHAEVYIEH